MEVPSVPDGSVDVLLCLLSNKRELPPRMLVYVANSVGQNPTKSDADHCPSVRF